MKKNVRTTALLVFSFFSLSACYRTIAQPIIGYQTITNGLTNPVDVVSAPGDNRLFIVQQNGVIKIWNGTALLDFINLNAVLTPSPDSEQGLLSVVFHPAYDENRYFFVWYTNATGAVTLARYQQSAANADIGDPATGQVLLSIAKPGSPFYYKNHNGGKLNFGPDGMLYISTGDGGGSGDPGNNAQNGNSLLGKLLRLNVNGFSTSYDIPADNPFVGAGGFRDEIYAFGLRNPWRWSFDRATGDMWLADVGQGAWEEVNWLPANTIAGANFGWKCYEGNHVYASGCSPAVTDTVSPVFEYGHNSTTGGLSITGGYVYRGLEFPALQGYYITTDYVYNNLWLIRPNGTGGFTSTQQSAVLNNISSYGEGAGGTLYAVKRNNGTLYKVIVTGVVPVTLSGFTATRFQEYNQLNWSTAAENNTSTFFIEFSLDGRLFARVGQVPATGAATGADYVFRHAISSSSSVYYRLAIQDLDGGFRYSDIVRLVTVGTGGIKVYPNVVRNGSFNVVIYEPANKIILVNSKGSIVFTKNMYGLTGNVPVTLPFLTHGVYVLQVHGKNILHNEKLIIQ